MPFGVIVTPVLETIVVFPLASFDVTVVNSGVPERATSMDLDVLASLEVQVISCLDCTLLVRIVICSDGEALL